MIAAVAEEPVYTYERAGLRLWVYRRRIDIIEGIDALMKAPRYTLAIGQIASIRTEKHSTVLRISMTDSREYTFTLGTEGPAAYEAIRQLL